MKSPKCSVAADSLFYFDCTIFDEYHVIYDHKFNIYMQYSKKVFRDYKIINIEFIYKIFGF